MASVSDCGVEPTAGCLQLQCVCHVELVFFLLKQLGFTLTCTCILCLQVLFWGGFQTKYYVCCCCRIIVIHLSNTCNVCCCCYSKIHADTEIYGVIPTFSSQTIILVTFSLAPVGVLLWLFLFRGRKLQLTRAQTGIFLLQSFFCFYDSCPLVLACLSFLLFNPRTVTSATFAPFVFFGVLLSDTLLSLPQSSGVRPHWLMGFIKESGHSSKYGRVSGPQFRVVSSRLRFFPVQLL